MFAHFLLVLSPNSAQSLTLPQPRIIDSPFLAKNDTRVTSSQPPIHYK